MSVIENLEPMLVQGFKNGMSFKQVKARIPGLCARKMGITEQQFHAMLEAEAGPRDRALNDLVERIVAQFTPAEQRAIALRK
jgi:hypothetical protein